MLPYQTYGNPYQSYNYNQMIQQPIPQQTPQQSDERIWVQNETSAEAYLVAPNGFVRLWDSGKNRFYEKKADNSGRPYPMEVYEYKKISPISAPLQIDNAIDYGEEIKALKERILALEKKEEAYATESNADDATT